MFLKSNAKYSDLAKQSVVDRYNRIYEELEGKPVDFGAVVAELIEAYVKASRKPETANGTLHLAGKK